MLTKALTLQVNFALWNIIKVVFVRNEIICVINMSFESNIFTTFNSNLHTHDMYLGGWVHPGEYASAGWYLIICN